MQPAPKAFAEGQHLPAKHGKRQRCVRRASEMSSHRAACRRFLQPHSGTLTVSGNARMELHDEPCTDKMSSGHCPHSPERSHGHQSSCGSRGMRRRPLADMWERRRGGSVSKSKDLAHACENLVFEDDTLRAFAMHARGAPPRVDWYCFRFGYHLGYPSF